MSKPLPSFTDSSSLAIFKAVMTAGDTPTLVLRHDRAKGRLAFEYRGGSSSYSSGTVYLT